MSSSSHSPALTVDIYCPSISTDDPNRIFSSTPASSATLILYVPRSRILWRELLPILSLESSSKQRISKRFLAGLLRRIIWLIMTQDSSQTDSSFSQSRQKHRGRDIQVMILELQKKDNKNYSRKDEEVKSMLYPSDSSMEARASKCVRRRTFRFMSQSNVALLARQYLTVTKQSSASPANVTIWIQPPFHTRLETAFERRLVSWEHCLIQAQTIAGYLSTLGGGFFMCHHFSTAVIMARNQQRMAHILNDRNMFYKCSIYQVYNFINAGHFQLAKRLLRRLQQALVKERPRPSQQDVLLQMCASALLFCRRVQKQASKLVAQPRQDDNLAFQHRYSTHVQKQQHQQHRKYPEQTQKQHRIISKTVDDFARIRLVPDESRPDDMVIPFTPTLA